MTWSFNNKTKPTLRYTIGFKSKRRNNKKKKIIPGATIKKTNIYSSIIGRSTNKSTHVILNNNTKNIENTIANTRQLYSFSVAEQGAIVESFLVFAEEALNNFLIKYKDKISIKNFDAKQKPQNTDVLCMLKFITKNINIFLKESAFHGEYKDNPTELLNDFTKDVRHKVAHGIVENNRGRWCDLDLQQVVDLTCKVVACLGSDCKKVYTAKNEFYSEIYQRIARNMPNSRNKNLYELIFLNQIIKKMG